MTIPSSFRAMLSLLAAALVALIALVVLMATGAAAQDAEAPLISIPVTPNLAISQSATSEVTLETLTRHIYLKHDGCGAAAAVYFDLRGRRHGSDSKAYNLRLLNGEHFEGFYQVLTIGVSPGGGTTATAATCSWTLVGGR